MRLYRGAALLVCLVMLFSSFHFGWIPSLAAAEDTASVTVNYVYASNQSMVAQPYRAQVAIGAPFKKTVEIPKLFNYSVPADQAQGLGEEITLSTGEDYTLTFDLASVTQDVTVTLYYVAGQAKYTVYHYYQNLEDDDYTDEEPTVVSLVGDIDAYTEAVANNRPGFHCKGVPQTTIAADGTTTVEIYYDRDYYTVTFDVNGGIDGPEPIYAKYGTTFQAGDIHEPRRAGYIFLGWEPTLSDTVTIESNITYKAVWQPERGQSDYTIVIWGQNANDDEYSYINSYEAWGNVGGEVSWNENTLISHVHTSDCYTGCDQEEHTHSAACLTCGKEAHVHTADCCTLEEHTHTGACYPGGTSTTTTTLYFTDRNPENGQIYYSYIYQQKYLYHDGEWYQYTGNLSADEIAEMDCTKRTHTHGSDCNHAGCGKEAHTHEAGCYGCGKEEHTHSSACSGLNCGLSDTPQKYMSALHPGTALWTYEKSDTVTVNADGSTVLNVYFTRREFTLTFQYGRNNSTSEAITARWGADIAESYKAVTERAGSSFWSRNQYSGPYTNYIGVMPQESIIYYNHTPDGSKTNTMTYYAQDLNGNYQEIFRLSFQGSGYTVTDEDRYAFEGFTYDHGTNNGADCDGAAFYYTRNEYMLSFYSASNSVPDSSHNVKYQMPLGGYDYTPTAKPETVESDAVFAGWYQNPECTGERYDLSAHVMPSHNIALYAKWVNGLYTVTTYTDETMEQLYTYEGYSGIQKDIEKYTLADEPTAPARDGYVFVGWFYRDGDAEKPFSFTMPITKDYSLYPKFSEPTSVTYTVHYYKAGGTEKVADDRTNSVMIGTTVTEKAKMGTELNLLPEDERSKYYPTNTSTSVIIQGGSQEIIFYYTPAVSMEYTVYYQDAGGKDLTEPVVKTTEYSTVIEYYKPIEGYTPRQYSITQDLASEADKNKIVFIYDMARTTLTIEKSGAQEIDEKQTFLFQVKGTDENTRDIDITVTVHGNGKTTIQDLPVGQYTVTEKTDWSWRYTPEEREQSLRLSSAETVTFANERTTDKWLDGNDWRVNHFDTDH